jgi:uroporphyrinogen III methyltransferase/synthase
MPQPTLQLPGKVFLVGAGPGDPGLITLRAIECLRRADLVLFDYLVNPRLLDHAPSGARRVCLGRHGHGRILSPPEINEAMIAAAKEGQIVVRLKAGDPIIFARAAEEIDALNAAGINFEIVPGITAALAAGSYAGIPLTMRDRASAVALVTGHESDDKEIPELDFAALAQFPGTLVVYMGVTSAPRWVEALMSAGKCGQTPAAIIRRCSWPDQRTIQTTLNRVPAEIATQKLRPPVIVIVGEVTGIDAAARWFTERPLFGKRILVTRPEVNLTPLPSGEGGGRPGEGSRRSLVDRLEDLGADVRIQPAITIGPPADLTPLDKAIARVSEFDWIVFSSANGVASFCQRLNCSGHDARWLAHVRLAVIGPGTRVALGEYHLRADLEPAVHRAESLAEALLPEARGKRFLLIRASRGREVLAEMLAAAGGQVEQVVAYESRDVTTPDAEVVELLERGRIDWVTVTSSAIARSLVQMFGDRLRATRLASISPITSGVLRELGFEPATEAQDYSLDGVVEAIRSAK